MLQKMTCYNFKKSKCCAFIPPKLRDLLSPTINLGNNALDWVEEQKYLGSVISCKCTDDSDISRHMQFVFSRGNILFSKFNACSDDVKVELFKSYWYNMLEFTYGMLLVMRPCTN